MITPNQIMFEIAKSRHPNLKLPEYPNDFFDEIERTFKEMLDDYKNSQLEKESETKILNQEIETKNEP